MNIITLCGSTKFFNEYMEANRLLTFNNNMVLSVGSFGHSFHKGVAVPEGCDYETVKLLHFHKIAMSHAICLCYDHTGYKGSSTLKELEFARFLNKTVMEFNGTELTTLYESFDPLFMSPESTEEWCNENGLGLA